MMTTQVMREDEEVKAQLIQRIDNLTADNDLLKSEMDLVRNRNTFKYDFVNELQYNKARCKQDEKQENFPREALILKSGVEKSAGDASKGREELVSLAGFSP